MDLLAFLKLFVIQTRSVIVYVFYVVRLKSAKRKWSVNKPLSWRHTLSLVHTSNEHLFCVFLSILALLEGVVSHHHLANQLAPSCKNHGRMVVFWQKSTNRAMKCSTETSSPYLWNWLPPFVCKKRINLSNDSRMWRRTQKTIFDEHHWLFLYHHVPEDGHFFSMGTVCSGTKPNEQFVGRWTNPPNETLIIYPSGTIHYVKQVFTMKKYPKLAFNLHTGRHSFRFYRWEVTTQDIKTVLLNFKRIFSDLVAAIVVRLMAFWIMGKVRHLDWL